MDIHLLTPVESDTMIATAAGLCVLIVFTRKFAWHAILSSLLMMELATLFALVPFLMLRAASVPAYRFWGFACGFGGTFILGAVVTFLEKLRDDPQGTAERALRLWRGKGGEP